MPRFFTPKELSDSLGVGYRMVLNEIQAGKLVAYRIGGNGTGGRLRISEADFQEWMDKHCRVWPDADEQVPVASRPAGQPKGFNSESFEL